MNEIVNLIEYTLIKNQETISLNALKEICNIYSLFNVNEIAENLAKKDLLNKNKTKYLPNSLQIEFIKRTRNNDKLARDLLVITNYNLVVFLTNHIYGRGNDKEDIIEYGILGLMHAIDNYDFDKNVPFHNYAAECIYGIIKRYIPNIMNSLKINRNLFYLSNKILKIEEKLMKELHRENISNLEILNELKKEPKYKNLNEKDILFLREYSFSKCSLDKELTPDNDSSSNSLKDSIVSDDVVEETSLNNLTYKMIRKIITGEIASYLTDRELAVIYYKYGFDKENINRTSEETAKILKISGARTRFIEKNALIKLRRMEILKNTK